jgi:hypothetical protein
MSRGLQSIGRIAAVLLPLAGLAGLWAMSDRTFQQGTEWEVPIDGFDPRDYLRGHYVEFTYDWPGVEEFRDAPPQLLCLEGTAPQLTRVSPLSMPPLPGLAPIRCAPMRAGSMAGKGSRAGGCISIRTAHWRCSRNCRTPASAGS